MKKQSIPFYKFIFHSSVVTFLTLIPVLLFPSLPIPSNFSNGNPIDIKLSIPFNLILVPFYFINVYYLIPVYLKKSKYTIYTFMIVACGIFSTLIFNVALSFYFGSELYPKGMGIVFLPMLLFFTMGTSFEMIINSETQRSEKEEIEKERVKAELSYLKSQIDPHFLFNSLNSIYSLAEMNSAKTGQSILLLADLMRYMLYEADVGRIELDKEIKMLENYIALQKLRISSKEDITIKFDIQGNINDLVVEPLLLLPFVENAFKYGISYTKKSEIIILLSVNEGSLKFRVFNSKKMNGIRLAPEPNSGIGLLNVKRRLSLLYPFDKHLLDIKESETTFEINLALNV